LKRFCLILVTASFLAIPLYSQPFVEPDLDHLPALLDSTVHISWEGDSSEWILVDRRIYTYDASGNLKTAEFNQNNLIRSVNNYYENGNQIEYNDYYWDADTNDWVGIYIENSSYDENGHQIEYLEYEWDSDIDDWVGKSQTVDTYNTSGLITGRIEYEWDTDAEVWRKTAEYFAYWSELGTEIPVREENQQLLVYPNPTNRFLTIESDIPDTYFITIYSQNGQMIYRTNMEGSTHQLNLSSFESGVYFITIRSKDFVTTWKIVKL